METDRRIDIKQGDGVLVSTLDKRSETFSTLAEAKRQKIAEYQANKVKSGVGIGVAIGGFICSVTIPVAEALSKNNYIDLNPSVALLAVAAIGSFISGKYEADANLTKEQIKAIENTNSANQKS